MVIVSKNPVQSILFLILVFLFTAIIFSILGAEFVSILMLIIYVGAIAMLFSFVVMLSNSRVVEIYGSYYHYIFIGFLIGFLFLIELIFILNLSGSGVYSTINTFDVNFWVICMKKSLI